MPVTSLLEEPDDLVELEGDCGRGGKEGMGAVLVAPLQAGDPQVCWPSVRRDRLLQEVADLAA